jgi:hypothetical protein
MIMCDSQRLYRKRSGSFIQVLAVDKAVKGGAQRAIRQSKRILHGAKLGYQQRMISDLAHCQVCRASEAFSKPSCFQ